MSYPALLRNHVIWMLVAQVQLLTDQSNVFFLRVLLWLQLVVAVDQ
jgi:hypothetical protein